MMIHFPFPYLTTSYPAVPALGDGLGLHAELVPGAGELGVLPACGAGAAGQQRDPGQRGVRRAAHVEASRLAAWVMSCHEAVTCYICYMILTTSGIGEGETEKNE